MADAFDLDAARAARAEAKGEEHIFIFGGQKFTLPAEIPAEFAYLLDDAKEAMRYLLGADFDDFWGHRPSKHDLVELLAWLTGRVGGTKGESKASGSSSRNGGSLSRPTSPATTTKTSAKPASGGGR